MNSITTQTVSGVRWLVAASIFQKAVQVCGTAILARILGPADFGLFALASVAIETLGLFRDMGFGTALIQRKNDISKAANTTFIIITVMGSLLYLLLFLSAPVIAAFLNNQALISILRTFGLIFVISCWAGVPAKLMERQLRFKEISIIETIGVGAFSTSAVVLALLHFGVWSLVVSFLIRVAIQTLLTFLIAGWHPTFEFDKAIGLDLFRFGKFYFLGGVVWFLRSNLDNILVGKFLGATALGLYAISFNIANFGTDFVIAKFNRVLFPALSKINTDKDALRAALLRTIKLTCLFAFPFCLMLMVFGRELLIIIYGTQWLGAVPVLTTLALVGLVHSVFAPLGTALNAAGHPRTLFWVTFFQAGMFVLFVAPATRQFGLVGVAGALAISAAIPNIFCLALAMKLLALRLRDLLTCTISAILGTVIMGIILIIGKFSPVWQTTGFFGIVRIIALAIFSCIAYILFLYRTDRAAVVQIGEMLKGAKD